MPPSTNVRRLSDEIVGLAADILQKSEALKRREQREFVGARPEQRAPIAAALHLTEAEVATLVAARTVDQAAADRGTPHPEVWEYDTGAATVADLTWRRDLLRNRVRVLDYLRVH